jgi:tRNA (cytidine/uridine-2'-O-)-methyltransferase
LVEVVLYQPEIAQNTGTTARTCAALGARLHLVRPLGFRLHDPAFKRAAMDYLEGVEVVEHASWGAFTSALPASARVWATTGRAGRLYTQAEYRAGDYLLFGPESVGLPEEVLTAYPCIAIPMPGGGRSLNLAVSVAIVAYEAARQVTGGWMH